MKKKILLVEDEFDIASQISQRLVSEGYEVSTVDNGFDALNLIETKEWDLLILDIMLPDIDGIEIAKKNTKKIPFIFVTARNTEVDELLGLNLGADDYIFKPFSLRILSARIKGLFARIDAMKHEDLTKEIIKTGAFVIDPNLHTFSINGENYTLTPNEFELLYFLMKSENKVITREKLLEWVWGWNVGGNETRTVDAHVKSIRKKIGDKYITTVHGVGYKFPQQEN